MDLLDRLLAQMSALQDVWMPFLLALFIVAVGIWKAIQWQHKVRIESLKSQLELYREVSSVSGAPAVAAPAVSLRRELTSSTIEQAAAEHDERVFAEDVTPTTLRSLVQRADSTLSAQRAVAPYEGKWFRISGTVKDLSIVAGDQVLAIVQDTDDSAVLPTLNLFFATAGEIDAADLMLKPLNAIGRFTSANPVAVNFWDCELVP